MKNSIEKEKGFSLLEMLLVLVIAVIFIIMSTRYYKSYQKTRDIGFFQTSVSELMGALNQYYFMNCSAAGYVFPNADLIPQLQAAGLIGKKLNNPWNNDVFIAKIVNTSTGLPAFYVLQVTAIINNSENNKELANYLRGALNADSNNTAVPNEVTWTRLPLNTRDDLSSHQWILNQGPGQQFMPGRYMTGMNTGTGSKFWILNSNLQSFSKTYGDKNAANCPN